MQFVVHATAPARRFRQPNGVTAHHLDADDRRQEIVRLEAEIEEQPHRRRVIRAGELDEHRRILGLHAPEDFRIGRQESSRGRLVGASARREKRVVACERRRVAPALKQLEHVDARHARGTGKNGSPGVIDQGGVGAVIEQQLEIVERTSVCQRVLERPAAAMARIIRICAVVEQEVSDVEVVV